MEADNMSGLQFKNQVAERAGFRFRPWFGTGWLYAFAVPVKFEVAVDIHSAGVISGIVRMAVWVRESDNNGWRRSSVSGGDLFLHKGFQ